MPRLYDTIFLRVLYEDNRCNKTCDQNWDDALKANAMHAAARSLRESVSFLTQWGLVQNHGRQGIYLPSESNSGSRTRLLGSYRGLKRLNMKVQTVTSLQSFKRKQTILRLNSREWKLNLIVKQNINNCTFSLVSANFSTDTNRAKMFKNSATLDTFYYRNITHP